MSCVENLQIAYCVNCRILILICLPFAPNEAFFGDCYRSMRHFLCGVERIKRFVNVYLHCIVSNVPSEFANTQDHQNCCVVKSHSRALATFQSNGKARRQEAIWMKWNIVRILIRLYIYYIIHKVVIHWKFHLFSPKIIMLLAERILAICSVQNYLWGNTADVHKWSCFVVFVFWLLSCSTHYELFVPFSSSCYYFIKITCNNKCYVQITTRVVDYSKQLKTVRFPIWRRALIWTASKWLRSLAATYKSNSTTALCWQRQIVVMRHIACWFRSGAVIKFDQFHHSSFFWTSVSQTFLFHRPLFILDTSFSAHKPDKANTR